MAIHFAPPPLIPGSFVGTALLASCPAIPLIKCDRPKPKFYESGFASGHAEENISVPGLLDWLRDHCPQRDSPQDTGHLHYSEGEGYRTGWAWTWIDFTDKRALVFLGHTYDGRKDVYTLTN